MFLQVSHPEIVSPIMMHNQKQTEDTNELLGVGKIKAFIIINNKTKAPPTSVELFMCIAIEEACL